MLSFKLICTLFGVSVFIALTSAAFCPDHKTKCRPNQTCCSNKRGSFGCCPYPGATCCSDGAHCCPHGINSKQIELKLYKDENLMLSSNFCFREHLRHRAWSLHSRDARRTWRMDHDLQQLHWRGMEQPKPCRGTIQRGGNESSPKCYNLWVSCQG